MTHHLEVSERAWRALLEEGAGNQASAGDAAVGAVAPAV
jgi:hypothetical protein